ncbi:Eukaryotic translation initiation factor 3 subunit K, variant 2 [Lathyrus oleraceus]|uniref:Eukaryotic translation initiation factor 3 subunit K n=1 Tax=Pisum sativum TaxID=3888 RepID=A0A9D4X868_PEA|nr:Eukaryotic translation initiation factor 3 subunit K, variant 2 [Pisum sativum]
MGREPAKPQQQGQETDYTVDQLVAFNRYNPDIFPDLENSVNEQVSSQTYSLESNLCLLRLYQFEPEKLSSQIVTRMLVKALMAMPGPDFSLCLFLIPERVTGRFRQFWDEAAKNRHILDTVPGFEQAIQGYAVHVLSLTYQKVPRTVLAEAINIEGLSLDKFLEHQVANSGWVIEKSQGRGQLIVLPRNEYNDPILKKNTAESVPLENITRIFPILS